jgi:hypothetical protein
MLCRFFAKSVTDRSMHSLLGDSFWGVLHGGAPIRP